MAFGMTAIALQAIVFAKLFPMYLAQVGSGNRIVQGIRFSVFLGMTVYSVMVFATAGKIRHRTRFAIRSLWERLSAHTVCSGRRGTRVYPSPRLICQRVQSFFGTGSD